MPSRAMLRILEPQKSQLWHPFVNTVKSDTVCTGLMSSGTFLMCWCGSHSTCAFVKAKTIQIWCSSQFNPYSGACVLNVQCVVAASMQQM